MASGFLVVLEPRISHATGNLYAGVGRVPPYPSGVPGEEGGMDEFLFGGVKDGETNLIPSLETAVRLCTMLSRGGRRFEVIYCRVPGQPFDESAMTSASTEHLGFDVAGVSGDYWSIVDDFPAKDWTRIYRQGLNPFGLFVERTEAESYLREYRAHDAPDADMPFDVVEVMRVSGGDEGHH